MALINGIASGDTTQQSTVLWARSSTLGDVTFEYSTDPKFRTVDAEILATVTDTAVPVKVNVNKLQPGTEYYYRVTDAEGDVESGMFRTAAPKSFYKGLTFGVGGDWQGELGPYPSISNVDEQNLDFFLQLGDTSEMDSESPALPGVTQAKTLQEFRTKHAEIYSDRYNLNPWADLRASTTTYATWDDHDVTNDFAGGASPQESPQKQDLFRNETVSFVNQTQAFQDALQAFQEYKPLQDKFYGETGDPRTANAQKLYRYNTFGKDAAMFVLDARSFRDQPLPFISETATPEQVEQTLQSAFESDRTMLGKAQFQELKQDLRDAQEQGTTWKFVMSTVPMQNFGIPTIGERWEGYAAERTKLLKFIEQHQIENVVFVTGDFHGSVVNNITYQEGYGEPQLSTGVVDVMMGPVGIQLTVPFLPAPFNETFSAPFGKATVAFTPESLLEAQGKSQAEYLALTDRADKDQYAREILDDRITKLGYDPIGLEGSSLSAELLQGEYIASHTYGWTEFAIAPRSQKLVVTVYGVEPYTSAELEADPDAVLSRTPEIVSQFRLDPVGFRPQNLRLLGTKDDDVLTGAGNADLLLGRGGDDILSGKNGDDTLFGDEGHDLLDGGEGRNKIVGGLGIDTFVLDRDGRAIVSDFEKRDRLQLPNRLSSDQLVIEQRKANVTVQFKDETLAVLRNIEVNILSDDNIV